MKTIIEKGYLEKFGNVIIPILEIVRPRWFHTELTMELLDSDVEEMCGRGKMEPLVQRLIKSRKEGTRTKTEIEILRKIQIWHEWHLAHTQKQLDAVQSTINGLDKMKGNASKDKVGELEYKNGCSSVGLKNELPEDNIVRNILEFLWDFNDSGNKMFRVEEQLTHELFVTEIKSVDESFLKLPYQCMGFHLPFNNKITVKDKLVKHVYISEYDEDEGRLIKMIIARDDDSIIAFNWLLKEGDIFAQIKTQLLEKYETKKAYKDMSDILQFIVAAILYINSVDVKSVIIQSAAKSILNRGIVSDYPVCSLGSGLVIDKKLHYLKIEGESEDEREKREMHVIKWTVRGHFRNQQYGSGSMGRYRKIIWIRPFIKGRERNNEDVPIKNNFYQIEK